MKPLPHYAALRAAATRLCLPARFKRDLTFHDLATCRANPPARLFAWCLRPCGTHIVFPDAADGVGARAWHMPSFIEKAFGREACHWFFWDGSDLHPIVDGDATAGEQIAVMLRQAFDDLNAAARKVGT